MKSDLSILDQKPTSMQLILAVNLLKDGSNEGNGDGAFSESVGY